MTQPVPATGGIDATQLVRGAIVNLSGVPYVVTGPHPVPATYEALRLPDLQRAQISSAAPDIQQRATTLGEGTLEVIEQAARAAWSARDELEAFKERVRTVAIDYAERYDWSEVVSSALGELGLPVAEKNYESIVDVRLSFPVTVRSWTMDAATQEMNAEYLAEQLYQMDRDELFEAINDYEAGGWTEQAEADRTLDPPF